MKKQFDLSTLDRSIKIKVLKALMEGKLTKQELYRINPEEIAVLLSNKWALIHVSMGEIHSYKFKGESINKEEYERLTKLSSALGNEELEIKVFDTGVPLAFNDRE